MSKKINIRRKKKVRNYTRYFNTDIDEEKHQINSPKKKDDTSNQQIIQEDENSFLDNGQSQSTVNCVEQNAPLVDRLNLSCNEASLEKEKQAFINKIVNYENPLTFRSNDTSQCTMLRYGEYSPNNPQLRVTTAPYLGLGEYDQRKHFLFKQRQADYKEHINKKNEQIKNTSRPFILESRPVYVCQNKSVQTDIQNINCTLVQCPKLNSVSEGVGSDTASSDKENCCVYKNTPSDVQRIDQRLTSVQNNLDQSNMDKPRSILSNRRTASPRERLLSDLKHGYGPSCLDELQRERVKREVYQQELLKQIEEKRRLTEMREEQERREQERENRRFEQQLMRMQEEQLREEQRRNRRDEQSRRNGEEFLRRKQELQNRSTYRKHLESESSTSSLRNTNVASKLSHYSPPVSRRNHYSYSVPSTSFSYPEPLSRYSNNTNRFDSLNRKDTLNRMDSLNVHDASFARDYDKFNRYDSLSRIDSLKQDTMNRLETLSINDNLSRVQRRHSATQQDLSMIRKSPKMQRRSSSSRLDDPLPIPVLKAHSPVARELKHSVAVNSGQYTSDALRKLEDKWQIPAVQKNILNQGDLFNEGHGRSVLTQLGAIRMQLQKEQLRMDETLRQRGNSQSNAVNFH